MTGYLKISQTMVDNLGAILAISDDRYLKFSPTMVDNLGAILGALKNLKCRIPIRLSMLIGYPLLISALIGILSNCLSATPYNMAETTED